MLEIVGMQSIQVGALLVELSRAQGKTVRRKLEDDISRETAVIAMLLARNVEAADLPEVLKSFGIDGRHYAFEGDDLRVRLHGGREIILSDQQATRDGRIDVLHYLNLIRDLPTIVEMLRSVPVASEG